MDRSKAYIIVTYAFKNIFIKNLLNAHPIMANIVAVIRKIVLFLSLSCKIINIPFYGFCYHGFR